MRGLRLLTKNDNDPIELPSHTGIARAPLLIVIIRAHVQSRPAGQARAFGSG